MFNIPADGEGLFVSEAFHEARIEVTEEGTKAASATGMRYLFAEKDYLGTENKRNV